MIVKVVRRVRPTFRVIAVGTVMIICGIVGMVALFSGHAATPTVSLEPEQGSKSGCAGQVDDTSASGGAAVRFTDCAAPLKPVMKGLANEGGVEGTGRQVYDITSVPNGVSWVQWSDLEPSEGSFNFKQIDADIKNAQAQEAAHPGLRVGIKIRLDGGNDAPDWVKQKAGTVQMKLTSADTAVAVPKWWTPQLWSVYETAIEALSTRYESNPHVLDINASMCVGVTDEPMVRLTAAAFNAQQLIAGGYTIDKDDACQQENINFFGRPDPGLGGKVPFATTHVSESFSTYDAIYSATDYSGNDMTTTKRYMTLCRSALGARCVLGNNEAGRDAVYLPFPADGSYGANPSTYCNAFNTDTSVSNQGVYAFQLGKPDLYYQSVAAAKAQNKAKDMIPCGVKVAIAQGASYYEIPSAVLNWTNVQPHLAAWNTQLSSNATATGDPK